jgi:hypothetical protein
MLNKACHWTANKKGFTMPVFPSCKAAHRDRTACTPCCVHTLQITNPNNTIRGNRAAGSAGYGFWYRMLNNPEGPSTTTTSCPKFTPLAQFKDNVAHSNMFYGFRIHPEYDPIQRPCDMLNNFQQVPAVFDGLISYKNGVKGAIATQVIPHDPGVLLPWLVLTVATRAALARSQSTLAQQAN